MGFKVLQLHVIIANVFFVGQGAQTATIPDHLKDESVVAPIPIPVTILRILVNQNPLLEEKNERPHPLMKILVNQNLHLREEKANLYIFVYV